MTIRTSEADRQYADAVIATLAGEFPGLHNPDTADIVRHHVAAHAGKPGRMEVIVDDPYLARWRLIADHDHPGRVWLGCWHAEPSDSVRERQERINAALAAIGTETQA